MGPHIPGRARRVGEARVGLQPLLRLRRNAAEDDVQSPEAHVNRLADRDARQAIQIQIQIQSFESDEKAATD